MVWRFGLDPTPTMDSHPYQKRRGGLVQKVDLLALSDSGGDAVDLSVPNWT